jgi:hypothetical protein
MLDKLKRQLQAVLAGETGLLEEAHKHNIDVDRVEFQIRRLLADKKVFGSDDVMDVIMAGYIIGRRDQFFASMIDLFGKDEVDRIYKQICIELGIVPKRMN